MKTQFNFRGNRFEWQTQKDKLIHENSVDWRCVWSYDLGDTVQESIADALDIKKNCGISFVERTDATYKMCVDVENNQMVVFLFTDKNKNSPDVENEDFTFEAREDKYKKRADSIYDELKFRMVMPVFDEED